MIMLSFLDKSIQCVVGNHVTYSQVNLITLVFVNFKQCVFWLKRLASLLFMKQRFTSRTGTNSFSQDKRLIVSFEKNMVSILYNTSTVDPEKEAIFGLTAQESITLLATHLPEMK